MQSSSLAKRITGFCLLLSFFCFLPNGFLLTQTADPFQQGLLALKQNRLDVALEQLTLAERVRPTDARVRNFRGIVLARLGRASEAEAEYRETSRLDPNLPDVYRNLGFLEWTEHRLDEARKSLRTALMLAPNDLFSHYYLGRVELDAKSYPEAFQELEGSRAAWPDDPDFRLEVAAGYVAVHREQEARKTLRLLAALPVSEAQSVRIGSLLLAVHENERALQVFRRVSQANASPLAVWAQFDLALAYLLTGHYREAVVQTEPLTRQTATSPDEASSVWTLVAIAHARLGDADSSIAAFRRAAELAPDQEERWLDLTRELMEVGKYNEAISAVQDGLARGPQSYILRLRLGAAYLRSGRYALAESVFRDLIGHGDPLPATYVGLCQVLLRMGRPKEAASELATAREKLGPSFLLAFFQGIALERAARPQESIAAFQEATRLNPQSAEAHLGLGRVELHEKLVQPAISELNEVLRLDSKNRQAHVLLSQAYRIAGDAKSALKYAEPVEGSPPPAAEGDLVGDFFAPGWKWPPEKK